MSGGGGVIAPATFPVMREGGRMGNRKRQKLLPNGRNQQSRFVKLEHFEMDCPAYREMSLLGKASLMEFRRRYDGGNNGEISFSVRELASRLGCADNTANKAINELQRLGWIKVAVQGTFTRKTRHATTWILTNQPLGDELPTKEYARWRPEN